LLGGGLVGLAAPEDPLPELSSTRVTELLEFEFEFMPKLVAEVLLVFSGALLAPKLNPLGFSLELDPMFVGAVVFFSWTSADFFSVPLTAPKAKLPSGADAAVALGLPGSVDFFAPKENSLPIFAFSGALSSAGFETKALPKEKVSLGADSAGLAPKEKEEAAGLLLVKSPELFSPKEKPPTSAVLGGSSVEVLAPNENPPLAGTVLVVSSPEDFAPKLNPPFFGAGGASSPAGFEPN